MSGPDAEPIVAVATEGPPAADSNDDLNCPLCGYDVRGLPEPRCPECGHQFDPAALRRERHERRDWLFEHARRRPPVAFLKTTLASLAPWWFWRRVSPAHAVVGRRLTLWTIAWVVIVALCGTAAIGAAAIEVYRAAHAPIAAGQVNRMRFINGARVTIWPPPVAPGAATPTYVAWGLAQFGWRDAIDKAIEDAQLAAPVAAVSAALVWPGVAMLAINLFGITLRRAGIRREHLRRCTLYAWPAVLLPVLAAAATMVGLGWGRRPNVFEYGTEILLQQLNLSGAAAIALLVAVVASTSHLILAHAMYLRLRHAVVQALLVSAVSWLAIAAGLSFVRGLTS